MASSITTSNKDDSESCILCSSKHNRNRPSFCQCKHCSIPLCLDCMKEHHEELLQDVAQILHQYNELQELLQIKQMMIVVETAKSIENVNQYFDVYINELRDTQHQIIANMEREKQNAQDYVRKTDSDLRTVGGEIQGLTKESIVQMTKAKNLSTELKKIEQQLRTYQVTQTENSVKTKPEFSIKFDCTSVEIETPRSTDMAINETCQTDPQEPPFKMSRLFNFGQSFFVPKYLINQPQENDDKKDESKDCSMSDDDSTGTDDSLIDTSYDIDRMASDGNNVLYTSYHKKKPDLIAYCLVDDDDDDDDDDDEEIEDVSREWKESRIKDMIWWGCVRKFICATNGGVYTVDYINKKFNITCVIRKNWSFIRVAANTTHLFIWVKSIENNSYGIEVYSPQFEHVRTIDFGKYQNESFVNKSVSFCVTQNLIASISINTDKQNNSVVLQVAFCDMNINELHLIGLGECNCNVEIRTDGKDQFFITTGGRRFHIIVFKDGKHATNLRDSRYNGKWLAVLNNRRVAISNGHSNIEVLTY